MKNFKNPEHKVVLLGPALTAVSGVSTHLNMIFNSCLSVKFRLIHFQVGREGRVEGGFGRLLRFFISPLQLAACVIKQRPHVVHINSSMDHKAFWRDFVYLIVVKVLGCKVVNQFHSGYGPQKHFKNVFLAWVMRRFLLWSDLVVVLSNQALIDHSLFDSRTQLELVPNAIDPTGLLEVDRLKREDGPLRLVFIGRLVYTKGLFEAIEAARIIKARGVSFTFKIAGSGSDENKIRSLIASYGLEEEVFLLGPVFDGAKNSLLLNSDILVFPTYFEGLPYSLLEAMAAGCVPVTCPVGGIPDVMIDGEHGCLVATKDAEAVAAAIIELAGRPERLQAMSDASRKRISAQYTVERLASRFQSIYTRMCS